MPRSRVRSQELPKKRQLFPGTRGQLELQCNNIVQRIRNDPSLGISEIKAACIKVGKHGFGMAVGPYILPSGRGYIICASSVNSDNLCSWIAKAEQILGQVNEIRSRIEALKNSDKNLR
jgi:hypothetical protein